MRQSGPSADAPHPPTRNSPSPKAMLGATPQRIGPRRLPRSPLPRPPLGHRAATRHRGTRIGGGARTWRRDRRAPPARRSSGTSDTRRSARNHDAHNGSNQSVVDAYHAIHGPHDDDTTSAFDERLLHLHPPRGHETPARRRRSRRDQGAPAGPVDGRLRARNTRRYLRSTNGGGRYRVPTGEWTLPRRYRRPRDCVRTEQCRLGRLTPRTDAPCVRVLVRCASGWSRSRAVSRAGPLGCSCQNPARARFPLADSLALGPCGHLGFGGRLVALGLVGAAHDWRRPCARRFCQLEGA